MTKSNNRDLIKTNVAEIDEHGRPKVQQPFTQVLVKLL